ncbi:MAG TPA: hypothetical protein VJN70_06150, partial [Gemmatimonadaceae bacterium]|nr:hypothetical protein [Gemmatimonadaceae bacterium]
MNALIGCECTIPGPWIVVEMSVLGPRQLDVPHATTLDRGRSHRVLRLDERRECVAGFGANQHE